MIIETKNMRKTIHRQKSKTDLISNTKEGKKIIETKNMRKTIHRQKSKTDLISNTKRREEDHRDKEHEENYSQVEEQNRLNK